MKKTLSLFLSFFVTGFVSAQSFDYTMSKSWDEKPSLHTIHKPYDSSNAVGILNEHRIEYYNENSDTYINQYYHFIVKLMTDNGIEMFNKIYIPVYENSEILSVQARSVLPNGKIINLDTTTIKETEEDNQKYKIFAFAGLEKGAEIEYAYSVKRNLSLFGSETFQQTNMPYLHAKFLLVSPAYLKFDAKGYNGFNVSADSVIGEQRIIAGYSNDLDEVENEKYAETDPYLQRVDYKLSYNLDKNASVRLFTWKEYAKKTYDYYETRTPKEEKALDGFVTKIKLDQGIIDAQKIFEVEDYVKNNINIDKNIIGDEADNIESIVKKKEANNDGAVRLFAGIFDRMGINYQIVFAGTRSGYTIDEELEDWNRVESIVLYFPSTGKFLAPASTELRYPYIPYEFTETRSLFLKGTTIGDYKTAIGTFGNIPIEPFDQNAINMNLDIRFDDDIDTAIIQAKQIFTGYPSTEYRPIYNFLTQDRQDEVNKEIIKPIAGDESITNIKIENAAFSNYFDNKPLIIGSLIKSTQLIENAGNKILFKVGAVIGPQEEMYQEKPRRLPVQLPYPHSLNRTIVLHIPDGYTIQNPDDININVAYKQDSVTTMGFVSSYIINNSLLTITINETYRNINYPLSEFEDFKKIINASADFNKVVLVFKKN